MQLGFLCSREGVSDSAFSSDEHHLTQPQRTENRSSTRVAFPGGATPFPLSRSCVDYAAVGKPRPGFSFSMERDGGNVQNRGWNVDGDVDSASRDGSDGDEDDAADRVDDDEFDDEDSEVDGLVSADVVNVNRIINTSSGSMQSSSERVSLEKTNVEEHVSCFGLSRTITTKCGNEMRDNSAEPHRRCEGGDNYGNAIIVVEPVPYCSQIFHGGDGASTPQKDAGGDNVYNFCSKRQGSFSVYPGESVRAHLSDPVTGILMDDAIILPCGHSFGVGGMQHVKQMKACFNCSLPISEDSVRPNLALRAAVQAFLREEVSHSSRISKRRRNRFEQDRYANDDQLPMDSRNRGVQFPFNVSDRVIIKGNKRTPDRFVGRIAVVTTQCLNGWYVVKTLDNAESVKLQYRSLKKFQMIPPILLETKQSLHIGCSNAL